MFGLMQHRAKAPKALPKQHQRMHYCGVCKAMGRMYGQTTRLSLNYDAIYLSELLTFLGEGKVNYHQEWSPALLSYNCLRLPKETDLPFSLQYAAAVNVLFTGIKLRDNVEDKGGFLWRTADKLMSSQVKQAEEQLKNWGLNLSEVNNWLKEHAHREKEETRLKGNTYLHHIAEATARITGMIFRQGAIAAGREDQADKMGVLGKDFGKLIYLLDAYRDYSKDLKKGEFNPIVPAFGIPKDRKNRKMPEVVREKMQDLILRTGKFMMESQEALALEKSQVTVFRDRIEENLEKQLGLTREEVQSCTTASEKKPRRQIRFATRWQFFNNVIDDWGGEKIRKRTPRWRTVAALGVVGLLAMLFPSFLHAKADWFSHVDPDFLNRFGDLHPDWLPKRDQYSDSGCGECCKECCDGGCRNCRCDNACDECADTCGCIAMTAIGIAILVILGIVVIVMVSIRSANKNEERRMEHFRANNPNHGYGPGNPYGQSQANNEGKFMVKVSRPDNSREILLASAHDWFGRHYPESLPQLDVKESYTTLYSSESFNIRAKASVEGKMVDFGKVQYSVQIHVRDGEAALNLEHFSHLGGDDVPPGGPLVNFQPQKLHKYLNEKGWQFLRDETTKRVNKLMEDFQANF